MSSQPKVSDDEMRYFQFKARQLFLLRKEDHDWNEFCKRNTCTCCSCQSATQPKVTKETAVQATQRKVPATYVRSVNSMAMKERAMPEALNEIKSRLEKIDLALSGRTLLSKEHNINERKPELNVPSTLTSVKFSQDPIYENRIQLIQNSLKQSIQRLQSSAQLKTGRPLNVKKKNSGYFIPHELKKQRTIARNAYLASLTKFKNTSQPSTSFVNEKNSRKQVSIPPKIQTSKGVLKIRKENNLKNQEKQEETPDQLDEIKKDKNIENAVEDIVDDLMGETVLLLNKIKDVKSRKSLETSSIRIQCTSSASEKPFSQKELSRNQMAESLSSSNWTKIRQNFLNLRKPSELREENTVHSFDHQNKPEHQERNGREIDHPNPSLPINTVPKTISSSEPLTKRKLIVEPQTVLNISKHRTDYLNYLERVSRTKKGHFDPRTLANMISEFLLDECIEEVAKELQDVPGFMVSDLYDQEFLQTL